MSMGIISDIIGLLLIVGTCIAIARALGPKRRDRNKIDGSMYDDIE